MDDYIRELVDFFTKPFRDVVDAVRARLAAVYQAFINILARVRNAFGRWVDKAKGWATAAARHALATYNRLRWIVTVHIPRTLAGIADSIRAWTRERIADALTLARDIVNDVRTWAAQRITDALTLLGQLRDAVNRRVADILADLTRVRDRVAALLTTPERLAAWLAGAMLNALVDVVIRDVDKWADYVARHRRDLEASALRLAERILDRIM